MHIVALKLGALRGGNAPSVGRLCLRHPTPSSMPQARSAARRNGGWQQHCGVASQSRARPDGPYHILVGDRPQRRITLRVLLTLPTDDDVLTELHELGCKQQFEAWVRARVVTKR